MHAKNATCRSGAVVVVIVWLTPFTTNVVSLNPSQARCTLYNIL